MKGICGLVFIFGFAVAGILTHITPRSIKGVNIALVKAGLAHYNRVTGQIEWNDVKNNK